MPRAVVLVEGISDRVAVETLAALRGRDLVGEGIEVVPIGGAQAIGRALARYEPEVAVAGLVDAGEERVFRRAVERAGRDASGFFVCDPDLEGELIRAVGAERVLAIAEERGDLRRFRTLQKQPEWRGRPVEEQLRRWLGSGGRRKIRYAQYLVEALAADEVPRPLEQLLERI